MPESPWDPAQYERFKQERAQPFHDLAALVRPRPGMRVVDLGCGTGELTAALHKQLAARETLGLDSSETMLADAAPRSGDGLRFERSDIAAFSPDKPFDLVFSNAALQWIPGHETLLPRLAAWVADRGQLAVQVPANHDHASQVVARELAAEDPYAPFMRGDSSYENVLRPERYAEILDELGFREQSVSLRVYGHRLASREDVIEWMKGTALNRFKRRLPGERYERFLADYRARLLPRLADRQPYFYAFKRILFWAAR